MRSEQFTAEQHRDGRDNNSRSSEMTPATLEKSAAGPPTAVPTGGGEGERVAGESGSAGEGEAAGEMPSTEQTQWLIMTKNASQAKCKELESQLASTREELTKRETRLDFAGEREKERAIGHMVVVEKLTMRVSCTQLFLSLLAFGWWEVGAV